MRVLVADDTATVRNSLRRALTLEGYEVETVKDGAEALAALSDRPPHAIILDILMPKIDGLEVCRRMRAAGDTTPVLLLTVRDRVLDRVHGLDAGADDYLTKPFALEELLARLRALKRRTEATDDHDTLEFEDLRLDRASRQVTRGGRSIELTPTEFELLAFFLRNPRRVLTRDILLDQVWGYPNGTTSNTLEVYIGYLRRKLEAEGEPRLIQTVRGVGYVLREP